MKELSFYTPHKFLHNFALMNDISVNYSANIEMSKHGHLKIPGGNVKMLLSVVNYIKIVFIMLLITHQLVLIL